MRPRRGSVQIVVNPITCEGRGLCAELLPEMIGLDDWGYPMIDPSPVPRHLEPHLRRAISACPTLALMARPVEGRPEQAART
jgi:ferredoxin